jgi:hypothetical protein
MVSTGNVVIYAPYYHVSVTYYHVSVKYNHVSVTYYHVSVTYLIHLAQLHDTHLGGVSVSRKEYTNQVKTFCESTSNQQTNQIKYLVNTLPPLLLQWCPQ